MDVEELKISLHEKSNVPVDQMRLIFEGKFCSFIFYNYSLVLICFPRFGDPSAFAGCDRERGIMIEVSSFVSPIRNLSRNRFHFWTLRLGQIAKKQVWVNTLLLQEDRWKMDELLVNTKFAQRAQCISFRDFADANRAFVLKMREIKTHLLIIDFIWITVTLDMNYFIGCFNHLLIRLVYSSTLLRWI